MTKYKNVSWTPEILAQLGKVPDKKIGEMLGVDETYVYRYRKKNGIKTAVYKIGGTPEIKEQICAQLGKVSDADLARSLGVSVRSVRTLRQKQKIPAHKKYLASVLADPQALIVPVASPAEIKQARLDANLTLREAATLAGSPNGARAWLHYESSTRQMGVERWSLFLLATNQHPHYQLYKK